MKVGVGIPTKGRPDTLERVVALLRSQSRPPDIIYVTPTGAQDLPPSLTAGENGGVRILPYASGSCVQRNVILRLAAAEGCDVLVFFDDDFVADTSYLECVEGEFETHQTTVISTGLIVADGARTGAIGFAEARAIVENHRPTGGRHVAATGAHGSNMAIRLAVATKHGIEFDERLAAYGWLEDRLFSSEITAFGACVMLEGAYGVHLGVRGGRVSGRRYGYSQVANPIYMAGKTKRFPAKLAAEFVFKAVASNFVKGVTQGRDAGSFSDRWSRFRGNMRALGDLATGRLTPERALVVYPD